MADPAALRELVQARYILEPQLAQMAAQAATEEEIRGLFAIPGPHEARPDPVRAHVRRPPVPSVAGPAGAQPRPVWILCLRREPDAQHARARVADAGGLPRGIHEHAAIAEAIAHRDGALAAQRMREHLQNDYGPYLSELTAPQP